MLACLCGGILEAAVLWLLSVTGVLAFGRRLWQRWRGHHTCSCPDTHGHSVEHTAALQRNDDEATRLQAIVDTDNDSDGRAAAAALRGLSAASAALRARAC